MNSTDNYHLEQFKRLDPLAVEIFAVSDDWEVLNRLYKQSDKGSSREARAVLQNEHVKDWHLLGPNEKYLCSKIYSDSSPVYIVGSVGTGKSAFLRYFINHIHKNKEHPCGQKCGKAPVAFLIDFNENIPPEFKSGDDFKIENAFIELLIDPLKEFIYRYVKNTREEITDIWDELIKFKINEPHLIKVSVASNLLVKLKERSANDWGADGMSREDIIKEREEILKEIKSNSLKYLEYLGAIIEYLQEKYFFKEKTCIMVIIENIDQLDTMIQHIVINRVNTFCMKFKRIKVVTPIRRGTFDNHVFKFQHVYDMVEHLNSAPIDIVIDRITKFLENTDEYKAINNFSEEERLDIINFLSYLVTRLNCDNRFRETFNSFCGENIRTALILAQYFLASTIYSIKNIRQIATHDLLRSVIIKANPKSKFIWKKREPIDNVFLVQNHPEHTNLLKIRILKLLSLKGGNKFEKISNMLPTLRRFGHSISEISSALWEMNLESKSLIWNDSCLSFEDPDEVLRAKKSNIYISKIGLGYFNYLIYSIDYIQEMAFSTPIIDEELTLPEDKILPILDRDDIFERLSGVFTLLRYLNQCEINDLITFLTSGYPKEEYIKHFRHKTLMSTKIIKHCYVAATTILDSRQKKVKQRYGIESVHYKRFVEKMEERINFFNSIKSNAVSVNIDNAIRRPQNPLLKNDFE